MRPTTLTRILLLAGFAAMAGTASAKFPPPSEEAKAKAAEAAAKTAWSNKVAAFQLCKAQDKVVARYQADMKAAGKEVKPGAAAEPCTDPGPFVYTPTGGAAGMTPQGNTPAGTTGAAPTPAQGAAPAASAPASAAKS